LVVAADEVICLAKLTIFTSPVAQQNNPYNAVFP
jgi:hypothetical protein